MTVKLFQRWATDPVQYIAINTDHVETIREGHPSELFDMAPTYKLMRERPPGCIISMTSGHHHIVDGQFKDMVEFDMAAKKTGTIKPKTKH